MNIPVDLAAGSAVDGEPGADRARGAAGDGEPLQRAASDRRLCQHAGSRSGAVAADTDKILKTFDRHLPRGTHIVVRGQVATMRSSFFGLGVGLAGRDSAGLPADRDQLPVVARSVHHHRGVAGSAGGNLLVPAADAHDVERAVADRRGHVHGRRDRELDSDGEFRARADGRGHSRGARPRWPRDTRAFARC